MTRQLLVLRHGKSSWSSGKPDVLRPLKKRGREAAKRVGAWLRAQRMRPDLVVSSPAERARATTLETCGAMGGKVKRIRWEERLYGANLDQLLGVLAECPSKALRVLLVGHNPGLEELVSHLAGTQTPSPADGKLLATASLAILELPDDWSSLPSGCASLLCLTRPGEAVGEVALGGKPRSGGSRPDYFYTQSAVMPYRLDGGKPEILIVSSRKRKRWVIPKGVKEPELSPRESAAKEAWEEAGVRGEVGEQSLGHYRYRKWGGVCEVEVFPMRVDEVAEDKSWEESHRDRRWVKPDEALRLLEEPKLREMLHGLLRQLEAE